MKVKNIEFINPEKLYERYLSYDNIDSEDLDSLLQGLGTGLDLACEKLKNEKFMGFGYSLIFNLTFLDFSYDNNKINDRLKLESEDKVLKNQLINKFKMNYEHIFKKMMRNSNILRLNVGACVEGYRDTITSLKI